jgi:hypothetical protein
MNFDTSEVFENIPRNVKFHYNLTRLTVLYMKTDKHLLQFLTEFFLERGIFQTKVVEKTLTYILRSMIFLPQIVPFEIMWKNMVEQDRPQMAI